MVSYEGFLQESLQEWRHLDAVPGQSNGFLKELVPGQLPVLSVDGLVASQFSGNADPLAACRRQTGTRAEKKFGVFSPPPSCLKMKSANRRWRASPTSPVLILKVEGQSLSRSTLNVCGTVSLKL